MKKEKGDFTNTKFSIGEYSPIVFCTPSQTAALLAEKRILLLLIRHGLTDWNLETRLQGQVEIPLNEKGKYQAINCAASIKKLNLPIEYIYSSPLSRAYDTAKSITDMISCNNPIILDSLIERCYGSVTGKTYAERKDFFKKINGYPDDMESSDATAIRMKGAIAHIVNECSSNVAIAVTHGGILNSFFSYITGGRAGSGGNIVGNCTFEIVAAGRKDVIPVAFNLDDEYLYNFIEKLNLNK